MKILCIGRALFDIVASPTKTFPPRYSAQELEKINLSPGGGGAITANILRRLGHDVTLLSYVGQDAEGSFLCDLLEVGGVD
ncbi:MAG: PfkB family carbohydrate kinase, partial [Planctomyces sp.]